MSRPSEVNKCSTSAESSNDAQLKTSFHVSYFNPNPVVQMMEIQNKEEETFTDSSANIVYLHIPETDFPEAGDIYPNVLESTGVEEEAQRGPDTSDMIHATDPEGDEMSRQENKYHSFNNDKINFMDSPECAMRTDHSDISNVPPAFGNLLIYPDFPSTSNQTESDTMQAPECVTEEHSSHEMHSNLYSSSDQSTSIVKDDISSETDNNAAAGTSGTPPRKRKYQCAECLKKFNDKFALNMHYRTHTREKPFVCEFCGKPFSQKGNRDRHIRANHL